MFFLWTGNPTDKPAVAFASAKGFNFQGQKAVSTYVLSADQTTLQTVTLTNGADLTMTYNFMTKQSIDQARTAAR